MRGSRASSTLTTLDPGRLQLEGNDADRISGRGRAPPHARASARIERRVWAQVAASERVYAIADEDLERENDEKTSSVHFLRFELAAPMRAGLARGAGLSMGVDHPQYRVDMEVPADIRASLVADLA